MKIADQFNKLKQKEEMALIAYTTFGYPTKEMSSKIIDLLIDNGADIIELGMPFSDPIADGPLIQRSSRIALDNGTTLEQMLAFTRTIESDIPIVLFSYANPLLSYGADLLFEQMKQSNISGIVVPDMPFEESNEFMRLSASHSVDFVPLVAPTSPIERIQLITSRAQGFIYCISTTGTTGMRSQLSSDLTALVSRVKSFTEMPVAVGFGISSPDQVRALYGKADGVIIGSRIIKAINDKENLGALIKEFKKATNREVVVC